MTNENAVRALRERAVEDLRQLRADLLAETDLTSLDDPESWRLDGRPLFPIERILILTADDAAFDAGLALNRANRIVLGESIQVITEAMEGQFRPEDDERDE